MVRRISFSSSSSRGVLFFAASSAVAISLLSSLEIVISRDDSIASVSPKSFSELFTKSYARFVTVMLIGC
jgi:hypothetical protein